MANKKSKAVPAAPPQSGGIKGWLSRNWSYLAAFFLPVALIYIAYLIFGLYPAGEHSVLVLDLNGQYVYYFEALRDAFHGDGSILYNWERNLSGGYQGIIGYYLASPFTLIVMLLPRTMILGALLIMILCKLGAASVAFCYYAQKSKHVKPALAMLLGTMFGMCSYGIIQTIDPMWLDGLVCLPMICLGVEYLIDDGRKLNYIIPLALICIANFYIGFMCCIFTAIYFVFYFFFGSDKVKFDKKNVKNIVNIIIRMAFSTAVAMCCAMFMILPVYNALALGKFDFTTPDWSFKTQFNVLDFIAQFTCVNQYSSVNVQGKPEIYSGVMAALCMPLFFLNRRIPLKKKIGYAFLCVVMFLCMLIRPVDMLWHGGQMPNWLPFRYSFIFSFIMLSMTAMTLRYATSIKKAAIGGSFVGFFVVLMTINHFVTMGADKLINEYNRMFISQKGDVYLDTYKSIWLTVLFLAVYSIFIYIMTKKNPSKGLTTALMISLVAVTGVELVYNARCEFEEIHKEVSYSSRKSYREYIQSGRDMVDRLYESDPGFYRAEKTYVRTVNDNGGFKLRGITHSSSVMNAKILTYIETMGYSSSSYFSRYDGNTPLADSVLGIKYVFDKGDENKNVLKKGENADVGAAYVKIRDEHAKTQSETDMDVGLYQNPNALSIGYMVSKDIERVNAFGNDNPFNSQNILLSTIAGQTTFTAGGGFDQWHTYYHPLTVTEPMRFNQCYQDEYGDQMRFREFGWDSSNPTVHQPDPTVDIFLETETDEPLYLFFKSENQSKVNLWLADQWNESEVEMLNVDGTNAKSLGSFFEGDNYHILYVGQYPAGQKLQLRMTLLTDAANTKEKYTIIKQFFFYHFNSELFEQDIKLLQNEESQWKLTKFGGRTLEGKITAKEGQMMMTSIPAEPGWKVWVDGKLYKRNETVDGKQVEVNYTTLFKAMIGVELEPGEHTVKMKYTPPGLNAGLFTLVCGLFCIVMFYLHDKEQNPVLLQMRANRKKGIYELPYEDDPDPDLVKKQKKTEKTEAESKKIEEISENMVADELRKLKELLDEGVLTKEEFEEQKKKLLK